MEKKLFFISMFLLLVLGCKDNDEEIVVTAPNRGATAHNAIPKKERIFFPSQGGSELLEWYAFWSDITLLNEYPASLYYANFDEDGRAKVEDDHILGGLFYQEDNEYAIKHPIVWAGDTLKGEWFRIIKKDAMPGGYPNWEQGGVFVPDGSRRCNKTIIEVDSNTTAEGRILVFAPYCGEPVFILQDKMED